ncbi:MAG TPA: asparagine synthase (glutamine-hydrolyzing) [Candidatus Polarisedimenticolaceae bacterium]|nr:asparagine synthase (glutamine-hydrolyzing) [Candidatus Polarisedimenticolaceae bacterium]
MCGICGVVGLAPGPFEARRERAAASLHRLRHRGPDETHLAPAGSGAIGATRLAIRGLHSGSQPFVDERTGVVVACNGEIDNHRELRHWLTGRGHSIPQETDVAVIPALYLEEGDAFAERLIGAFAVAVWDPRAPRIVLARDRAGEKPLFYVVRGDEVAFASELAGLATDADLDLRIDPGAIAGYMRRGCFVAPQTPFVGVSRVRPGEVVTIEPGRVVTRKYWNLRFAADPAVETSEEAFDRVFTTAVARQSDVSVPCGVFLSGGLDSSLVTAVARKVQPLRPLRAFTIRFAEQSYDEGGAAAEAAKALDVPWTSVEVGSADVRREIELLVSVSGEPLADPAWIPASMLSRRAVEDVRLVMVGEGADELFGGYPTYIGALLASRYGRLPGAIKSLIASAVNGLPVSDKKITVSYLLKRFVEGDAYSGLARHLVWTSQIAPHLLRSLGVPPEPAIGDGGGDILDVVQCSDFETTLAEGLLTKADRAGMGCALELRAPFLDLDVLRFASALPATDRVRGFTTKVFLKRFARRYLPVSLIERRKRGLSVPLASWLRGPLYDWTRERLASSRLEAVGLDSRAAVAILDEHRARKADRARAIWTIVVLSVWLEWLAGVRGKSVVGGQ